MSVGKSTTLADRSRLTEGLDRETASENCRQRDHGSQQMIFKQQDSGGDKSGEEKER